MNSEQRRRKIRNAGYTLEDNGEDGITACKCGYYYNMPTLYQLELILFSKKRISAYTNDYNYYVITCRSGKPAQHDAIECYAFKRLNRMKLQDFLNLPELSDKLTSWRSILKYLRIQKIEHSTKIHNFGSWRDAYAKEKLDTFTSVPLCYSYYPKFDILNRQLQMSIDLQGIEIKIPTDHTGHIIFLRELGF